MHNFVKTTGAVFLAASVFLSAGCSAGEEQSAVHIGQDYQ